MRSIRDVILLLLLFDGAGPGGCGWRSGRTVIFPIPSPIPPFPAGIYRGSTPYSVVLGLAPRTSYVPDLGIYLLRSVLRLLRTTPLRSMNIVYRPQTSHFRRVRRVHGVPCTEYYGVLKVYFQASPMSVANVWNWLASFIAPAEVIAFIVTIATSTIDDGYIGNLAEPILLRRTASYGVLARGREMAMTPTWKRVTNVLVHELRSTPPYSVRSIRYVSF